MPLHKGIGKYANWSVARHGSLENFLDLSQTKGFYMTANVKGSKHSYIEMEKVILHKKRWLVVTKAIK